ncbi:ATP-binding protein [Gilvimarinus sp. F26214L]|uniref:ATP-binding protein n=1 Tax=Gilvimarinus sp. DZF01 TaxID=3461371 RepID=UPI0040452BAE
MRLPAEPMAAAVIRACTRLAWATRPEQARTIASELCHALGAPLFGVYQFRQRRKGTAEFYALARAGKNAADLPGQLESDHPAFKQLQASVPQPSGTLPFAAAGDCCLLRLNGEDRQAAILVLKRTENADLLTHLRRFAMQLVSTAQRIARDERQLRHQEALNQLFLHTSESFCEWSRAEGWRYHNKHLLQRLGYNRDQLPLINVFGHPDVMSAEEWSRVTALLEQCIESATDVECEYQVHTPTGEPRTLRTRLRVLQGNSDGRADGLAAVSVDVSTSRRVEQNASAHTELERWLLAINGELFNRCDKDAVVNTLAALCERLGLLRCFIRVYENNGAPVYAEWQQPGVQAISELSSRQMVPLPDFRRPHFVHDIEEQSEYHGFLDLARASGTRAQIIMPMSYGGRIYGYLVCHSAEPRRWKSLEKRAARILADSLCMVAVKEAIQHKLEASREQFQLAMEAASYGLWELNIPDQTVYVSPHYYRMLGFTGKCPTGFGPMMLNNIHYEDRQNVLDHARGLSDGSVSEFSFENRHIDRDGNILWILMRGKIIKRDDTGKPLRAMGTLTDITALKKTQANLTLARQQAESAHLAKSEFLARMSHEIRTPMNAIIGIAYLAMQSSPSDELRAYVEDIDAAARSLLHIIDDILDFSKIEAGKVRLEQHRFDLRRLVTESAAPFRTQAAQQGLEFEMDVARSLPASVLGDTVRLRQVLHSLLSNACKFTRAGRIALSVSIREAPGQDLLDFQVSDTGIGLSADQIDGLFDPFTQGDSSPTRQYGGTGLGLAIAQGLIRMMGGEIEVSSHIGRGSTFRVTIPCLEPVFDRPADPANPRGEAMGREGMSREGSDYACLKGRHVLLVEDNPVNQKVAMAMLEKIGVVMTVAADGRQALDLLGKRTHAFDLILMDIEMPHLNGFEASQAIKALPIHYQSPIIAMTAHAVEDDRQRYYEAGIIDCLSKPILPARLYAAIVSHLRPPASP